MYLNNHSPLYQEAGACSHPFPDLAIRYPTGIKIAAEQNYGGVCFYKPPQGTGSDPTFSINNGEAAVRSHEDFHVEGSLFEHLDIIATGGRNDWRSHTHPIMQYFKGKRENEPIGTMCYTITDHPGWQGHYWQGWKDVQNRIRVVHNHWNTDIWIT